TAHATSPLQARGWLARPPPSHHTGRRRQSEGELHNAWNGSVAGGQSRHGKKRATARKLAGSARLWGGQRQAGSLREGGPAREARRIGTRAAPDATVRVVLSLPRTNGDDRPDRAARPAVSS